MKIKNLFFLLLFISGIINAQNSKIEFRFIENQNQNDYTIIFTALGIKDTGISQKIISDINSLQEVKSAKCFYNRRFKLIVDNNNKNIAQEVRVILNKYSSDFDADYLIINDKIISENLADYKKLNPIKDYISKPKDDLIIPEGFPKYKDTGNPVEDRVNHSKEKLEWLENNPEKYKEMYGFEYLDYSDRLGKIK